MNFTLDPELQVLKENLLEMLDLVIDQMDRCKKAITKSDTETAKKVLESEKRLNEMEILMDRDCENILALHQPVATDLRFVLSVMKMSNDLERMGDNLKVFATFLESGIGKNMSLIRAFKFEAFLELFIARLEEIKKSIKNDNTDLVKKILKSKEVMEKRKGATKGAEELIQKHPDKTKVVLRLYAIVQRMARIGSLINNVAEEVIFYKEAKVLKHTNKK